MKCNNGEKQNEYILNQLLFIDQKKIESEDILIAKLLKINSNGYLRIINHD